MIIKKLQCEWLLRNTKSNSNSIGINNSIKGNINCELVFNNIIIFKNKLHLVLLH